MADLDANADEQPGVSQENLERIIPDVVVRKDVLRIVGHLESDQAAIVVLKGHLLIETTLTDAIERFVFHPAYLNGARLTFAQKLAISRSMSLDRHMHPMWDVISKLNRLRNTLSHSLDGGQRTKAMESLRAAYLSQSGGRLEDWEKKDDAALLTGVISMCMGFVGAFEREIERFKSFVNMLDRVVNEHRHSSEQPNKRG